MSDRYYIVDVPDFDITGEYKTVDGKPAFMMSNDFVEWLIENDPELRELLIQGFRKVFDKELEKANAG